MKYYSAIFKRKFEDPDRIIGQAQGKLIPDNEFYFNKIRDEEEIDSAPIFDYFYLQSYDRPKYWEWKKQDVHSFIGKGSQINGWFVSDNFKKAIDKLRIAEPFKFYESRLLYKEEKYVYWIFRMFGNPFEKRKMHLVDFLQTFFSYNGEVKSFNSLEEYFNNSYDFIDKKTISQLTVKGEFDLLPLSPISSDILVSENFKDVYESAGLEGLEFVPVDTKVVII